MNGESSKRGAVEEIISKRLRVLNKKIARIKSYDQTTLNADQKLAVASLPPLEAVAKELEDLIKPGGPVETAELAQAGQIRQIKEELLAEHDEQVQREFNQYKKSYHRKLGGFLRTHHNLNQQNLREKITPHDVFQLREMYEQLKDGKEVDLNVELLQVEYVERTPGVPITNERDDETSDGFSTPARSPIVPLEPTPPPALPVSHIQGFQEFTFTVDDEVSTKVDENKVEETPKLIQDDTPKTVDWAEEVDEEGPIFATPVLAEGQDEIPGTQQEKPVLAPVVQDTPTSSKSKKGKGQGKPKGTSSKDGTPNGLPPKPQSAKGKGKSQDGNKNQVGDDDGFEQVVRKQASSRGRGGPGAGSGAGGRGRGRGRGGMIGAGPGNGARNGSGVKAKVESGKEGQ